MARDDRGSWTSRFGFILAASGSAIGLGNIVFFPANAYQYGGGAFYVPYFIALFLVGIPVMTLELGLGRFTGRGLPIALGEGAGKLGEWSGWFGVLNTSVISMYYVAILGWVVGMWFGCFSALWEPSAVPAFDLPAGALSNSMSYFFDMISRYRTIGFVVVVWAMNYVIVLWGATSIEKAVKWFVPAMWLMMMVLIVRGVTLPDGVQGVYWLFTPDFEVMKSPDVWLGAFSQMFFTLSLGFGIMTTYASYLPKDSDDASNASTISLMNCSFEFIAGLAIFSLLFAFAISPKASTLSMMFFIVPEGIARFPFGVKLFGLLFFTLLLLAGLSSSVSLLETIVCSILDKMPRLSRWKVALAAVGIGLAGSVVFALPVVVDKALADDGTLGLTLLDMFDHWSFKYGLMTTGLLECLLIAWVFDFEKVRAYMNETAHIHIGSWFQPLIGIVIPMLIVTLLGWSVVGELQDGVYGPLTFKGTLRYVALGFWLLFTIGGGAVLASIKTHKSARHEAGGHP